MKTSWILLSFILGLFLQSNGQSQAKEAERQIFQTEKSFATMAMEKGLAEAFSFYADSNAVINRGGNIIRGKDSIRIFYLSPKYKNVKLVWLPDFVEVSSSADLGYTYGKFTWSEPDSAGKALVSKGYFHTVWKREKNGEWRFVWD